MCKSSTMSFPAPTAIGSSALVVSSEAMKPQTNDNHSKNRKHRHPHIVVEHHYHDHANEAAAVDERPARGGVTMPFPVRLHTMLDKMEADGHGDVISWQPHGRCFVVRKPKEFRELLPAYFKLSKMASFQRQLNLYGFQRLTRGRDKNAYYHEYFLRGKVGLSSKIQRTKVKGTGVRARSSPTTEPHLWELPWVTPAVSADEAHHHHSDNRSVTTQEDEDDASDVADSPHTSPATVKKSFPKNITSQSSSFPMPPLTSSYVEQPMPPLALAPSSTVMPAVWSTAPTHQQQEEAAEIDTVMSFGGKCFHYLDPRALTIGAHLRKKQDDDMQNFMSTLELDNLYSGLDDATMDNDDAFMTMLERVVFE